MARIAGAHQGPGCSLAHSYLFSKPFQLGMTESTSDSKQVMERSMMVIISLCSRFPIFGYFLEGTHGQRFWASGLGYLPSVGSKHSQTKDKNHYHSDCTYHIHIPSQVTPECNQNATMIGGCACCVLPSGSHAIERKPTNDFPHPLPPHHQHSRCQCDHIHVWKMR